jgi:hypothetical protein
VGDAGELEPVAKIMLQDIRILRVVRPGDEFLPDGSRAEGVAETALATDGEELGQVILEVTPEQAELLTFIQDEHHEYQLIVRAKDDHAKVNTFGITFELLATDPKWALPWPVTITAPDDDANSAENGDEDDAEEVDAEGTDAGEESDE